MSVLIKNATMPTCCDDCNLESYCNLWTRCRNEEERHPDCPLVEIPPHGDLVDRDALIKDGWLCLHKEVMRMGGYAIHELPLKNPSIPVIIEAEEGE